MTLSPAGTPEAWLGTTSWIIAVRATSDDVGLLASHPMKPEDGCDATLFCAAASVVIAPQSRITGSNGMNSLFIITFLSFESPSGAKSKIHKCLHGSKLAGRTAVCPDGDLRRPVLRIGN
jgi:hypothetical protein